MGMTAPETSTREAAGAQVDVEPTAMDEPTEPDLGVLAVDAHCHLQYQKNPGLALARAGLHGVGFMCTVVDVCEDGTTTYDSLSKWNHEAALSMQRLFSRC